MQLNQQVDEKRWDIRTTVGVGSEPRDAGLQVSLQKQEVGVDTVVLEDVEVVGRIHRGLNSPSTCTGSWGYSWNFVALCSSVETNNLVNEQTHKMLESIESLQNPTNEDFSFS